MNFHRWYDSLQGPKRLFVFLGILIPILILARLGNWGIYAAIAIMFVLWLWRLRYLSNS